MGSQMSGRDQPTGVNSPSAANAAHAARLSARTAATGDSFLAAQYSAAASVAAATDAVARPVTSKADGRKARGPPIVRRAATSGAPPASVQTRAASSAISCVMLTILDATGPDNQR